MKEFEKKHRMLLALGLLTSLSSNAADVNLAWDASISPNVGGYIVAYGTSSGNYSQEMDVGNMLTATVPNLANIKYYFAVKAYSVDRAVFSEYSNEVSDDLTPPPLPVTCPCSFWSINTVPTTISSSTQPITVGMKFTSSKAGKLSGIRFYTGAPSNSKNFVAALYTVTGKELKTVDVPSTAIRYGWVTVPFPAVALMANTTYIAAYYTSVGAYASDVNGLLTPVVEGPLSTVVDGKNGVYSPGKGLHFPKQSQDNTNYYVDIEFTPNQ